LTFLLLFDTIKIPKGRRNKMLELKMMFAVLQILTGLFFIRGFAEKDTNTIGKLFCGLGMVEFFIFVWIVANRNFF
jgi:hypothetical protein